MKFIDIFAGIGAVRLGMEKAGHECVYSIERDKFKRQICEVIFGEKPQGRDIRNTRANELPRADCWCFGFPCQDISVAGKQKGFTGHRSSLFFTVTELIRKLKKEDRPSYLLIENVKNFLSVNGGYDFLKTQIEMDEIGYDAEWQLLNSKNFGVPQNRERVFIVGHFRGRNTRKVFPIERSGAKDISRNEKIDVRACITPAREKKRQNGRRFKEPGEPMFTLTKQDIHGVAVKEATKKGYAIAKIGDSINFQFPNSKTRRGRVGKGVAQTLETSCNQATLTENYRLRKLTPKECWRLQGMPDYITDKVIKAGISDTQMYKGAGDACTVSVIKAIAERMGIVNA